MPLKHHTETVFILVLCFIICVYGALLALLPHFPQGVLPWCILLFVATLYPVALLPTFRSRRADYEFRFLHWFPAVMTLGWLALELLSHRFILFRVLQFGGTALWSLPLVFFGLVSLTLFSLHVIRRRSTRIVGIGMMFAFFTIGALTSHELSYNPLLASLLYPQSNMSRVVSHQYQRLAQQFPLLSGTDSTVLSIDPAMPLASIGVYSVPSSRMASSSSSVIASASSSSFIGPMQPVIPPQISRLPRSGPDTAAALALTCLSFYCALLHVRARARE